MLSRPHKLPCDGGTARCQHCGFSVGCRSTVFHACPPRPGLGDVVADGLAVVGITSDRVSRLIGWDCGCPERAAWLNDVGHRYLGLSPGRETH